MKGGGAERGMPGEVDRGTEGTTGTKVTPGSVTIEDILMKNMKDLPDTEGITEKEAEVEDVIEVILDIGLKDMMQKKKD